MAYAYNKNSKGIYVFFGILSLIVFLVSASVLPFLSQTKNFAMPDLALCLVCILPCFMSVKTACIYALSLGFLSDLFINSPVCFSPVIYLAAVCIMPYFHSHFSRVGTVTAAVCSIPAFLIRGTVGAAVMIYVYGGENFKSIITAKLLPELGVNLACSLVICAVIFYIVEKSRLKSVK